MAVTYLAPPENEVYGVDLISKKGKVKIQFANPSTGTVGMYLYDDTAKAEVPVTLAKDGNNYTADLLLPIGNYEYYFTDSAVVNVVTPVPYKFSVGYVFVIASHSLGSSNGEKNTTDDRVFIYNNYQALLDADWKTSAKYTGGSYRNPDDIYASTVATNATAAELYDKHEIGPWSWMAHLIAERDSVNVAIINCSMGGSSVEMWADEAAGRPFLHGFASTVPNVPDYNLYNSGIPYFHFENVLKTFGNRTGITAVLVQHGENDMQKPRLTLANHYKTFIEKARSVSGLAKLPVVIAKSAWLVNSTPETTQSVVDETLAAVDETLKIVNYAHVGPDLHLIPQTMRGQPNKPTDGHWNVEGSKEAGRLWAEKLTLQFLEVINNGVSTLPIIPPVTPEPLVTPGNTTPTTNTNNAINYVSIGLVAVGAIVLLFLLKFLKVFANLSWKIILGIGVVVGLVFYGISYFFTKKTT